MTQYQEIVFLHPRNKPKKNTQREAPILTN
jgi:hypothetical protein